MPDLVTISRLTDAQLTDLLELYRGEWWTRARTLGDVRRMLAASQIIVGFADAVTAQLLAFARVLTDGVYKALVLDVIVAPSRRGTGLGKHLLDTVLNHPQLRGVQHFELYCRPDMASFYERWGFTEKLGDLRFMRFERPAAAANSGDRGSLD
jgi:GNAT superfamily N-acetyltransferase